MPTSPSLCHLEELANTLSHGLGLILSVLVTIGIIGPYRPPVPISSGLLFGLSLMGLYSCSTFYHAARKPKLKKLLHILDHASIFALIAGTYTVYGSLSDTPETSRLLFLVWTLAAAGICLKVFCTGRWPWLSTLLYLLMGWLILIHPQVYLHIPTTHREWLLYGGISYSLGTIFYLWKRLTFHHFIWHLWVLLGSGFHVVGLWQY